YTWISGWYPGTTTHYVYDGKRVIQERTSNPTVSYTRGADLSGSLEGAGGIGGLLSRSHAYQSGSGSFTNHNYYHADGNGNITYMVDTNQSMVASYRYDPFGNTISSSGTLSGVNVYRFSSKERHNNSGMYYYGYRWYDPNLQRWPNRDPLGEFPDGPNLYAFVGNNPLTRVDIDGLTWRSNWDFFWDWALGRGGNNRNYNDGSTESGEMKNSPGGQAMRDKFYKGGCKDFNNGNYGTGRAAWDTLVNPSTADWSGTGAQVGGFGGATATDNGNGTVTFCIPNVAGTHSFFYHIVPDRSGTTGPGRNIKQTICWTEPIDKSKCPCPK
ncbi:MAG TPA: RHS repeat-associated core domain-containing protein, partial [Candidatus Angelobacter sp.]|nr:RHS repeat-associated core domain-containing protein [Candidatus Angelobacter sp.]